MTRHNDHTIGVANRMTWTVTAVADDGSVNLHHDSRQADTTVDAEYVQQYLHLAYATTVHGVQGETADHSDTVLGDQTDSPGLYVALTRGRHSNTIHITANTLDQAKEQWVQAAGRNRADLGLDQARAAATTEAHNYAPTTPTMRVVRQQPAAAGKERLSFAERLRRISVRDEISDTAVVVDADAPEPGEWDLIEHQGQHNPTHGPRL
jgi:hypothetical protein